MELNQAVSSTIKAVCYFALVSALTGCFGNKDSKITVQVFESTSQDYQFIFEDFTISVPEGWVVVGGGVYQNTDRSAQLLFASYPSDDLDSWVVSTKSHADVYSAQHITGYALGLKIDGLTEEQLREHISLTKVTGAPSNRLNVSAGVQEFQHLIGGGVKIDFANSGMLAIASYPETPFTWMVKGKDHIDADTGVATAYAIGIDDYIPNIGEIEVVIESTMSETQQYPEATSVVPDGYSLTSCGAEVINDLGGAGSLLTILRPFTQGSQTWCNAAATDSVVVDPASIISYSIGIKDVDTVAATVVAEAPVE